MENNPTKKKTKSTQAEKDARVLKVLELIREGKNRITIIEYTKTHYKISKAQTDNYIAKAKKVLEAERAEMQAAAKKERQERELAALAKIPTPAEIILNLLSELNIDKPVPTGFELKIINNEPKNIKRFASEAHRQFVLKTLLAYSLEMTKTNDTDTEEELTALSNDQLNRIAEIIK